MGSDNLQEITVRSLQELDELVAEHIMTMPGTYGYIKEPGVSHVILNRTEVGLVYYESHGDNEWHIYFERHGWWLNKVAGFGKHPDRAVAICIAALHSFGFLVSLEVD